jgi:prolyl-tRNA editing enzyme YbaK/EbsC (Cys-tRNA(Pro) deacylase)
MTVPDLPDAVRRVRAAIGPSHAVRTFDASTRTSAEAAAAIGCAVAQIAKSIVFRARDSGRPVLVVLSGADRASEAKVAALLGERVARADAAFVRSRTGYAIGGVPPVAHLEPPVVFVDTGLRAFDAVWAAAGTPNAVFETTFDALVAMSGATAADVAERVGGPAPAAAAA